MAFQHQAGTAMECLSVSYRFIYLYKLLKVINGNKFFFFQLQIPITLHKETEINANGEEVMKCGFKIGGGIDQDFHKSPQGYTDNVRMSNKCMNKNYFPSKL